VSCICLAGGAVPWNGLVSVNENRSREVKSYYMDGFKFLDYSVPGAYSAKLQAFTYPDELDDLIGNRELFTGLTVYDQRAKDSISHIARKSAMISRTKIMATTFIFSTTSPVPKAMSTYNTIDDKFSGAAFEWNLYGVPPAPYGFNWTSHFSINSREYPGRSWPLPSGIFTGRRALVQRCRILPNW
jgi:hypothetical protein